MMMKSTIEMKIKFLQNFERYIFECFFNYKCWYPEQ